MITLVTAQLTQRELDILDGPVFPANPSPEYFLSGSNFGLTELGSLLYSRAFAKVGMRVDVRSFGSRRSLDEAVYRGREILYDLSEAVARDNLAKGITPPQLRDIEQAFMSGNLREISAAGSRLDAARLAGDTVIPANFTKKRHE